MTLCPRHSAHLVLGNCPVCMMAEIERLRERTTKIDATSLRKAAGKLRRLRVETVHGRKERPTETVASVMDRAFNGIGSIEAQEWILRHGLKYYFEALAYEQSPQPMKCEGCDVNYADPPSKLCPGCQAYREHQA